MGPVADGIAAREDVVPTTAVGSRRLEVERIEGTARVLAPDGGWRATQQGETAVRPTGLAADGLMSSVQASLGGQHIQVSRDARLVIGDDSGGGTNLQLDRGHLLVSKGRATTHVPQRQMRITGNEYGVWADAEQVVVAVNDGEVEIQHRGETAKYAKGREIVFTRRSTTPRAMDPELGIAIVDQSKKGKVHTLIGQTSPGAFLFRKTGDSFERVSLGQTGRFTLTSEDGPIDPTSIIVFDASGRIGALGNAPEAMKSALGGSAPKVAAEPPPEPVEKKAPDVPKMLKRPKVEAPAKPEAKPPKLEGEDLPALVEEPEEPAKMPDVKEPEEDKKEPDPAEADEEDNETIDESDL
jgi:hypothetical protein